MKLEDNDQGPLEEWVRRETNALQLRYVERERAKLLGLHSPPELFDDEEATNDEAGTTGSKTNDQCADRDA